MKLTRTQQRILDYLTANRGIYLSAKTIANALDIGVRVEAHVYNMRRKGATVLSQPGRNGWTVA